MTDIEFVKEVYSSKDGQDYESKRLEVLSPVEYAVTKHLMKTHFPKRKNLKILEVGVGYGHYSEFIVSTFDAKIALVDITPKFLEHAKRRLIGVKKEDKIISTTECSATELDKHFQENSFDVVVFLGPMYHLIEKKERAKALQNVKKVLRVNGVVFIAAINRVAAFRDIVRFTEKDQKFIEKFQSFKNMMKTGIVTKEMNLPIGVAYFHKWDEFEKEVIENGIEKIIYVGTESFGVDLQGNWNNLTEENKEKFLELVYMSMDWPEGYGRSDHFLFIGKKKIV